MTESQGQITDDGADNFNLSFDERQELFAAPTLDDHRLATTHDPDRRNLIERRLADINPDDDTDS